MIANILTKSLNKSKHAHCINKIGFSELHHCKASTNDNHNMHQFNFAKTHAKEECSS